jgi:phosphatidylglycerophosphatase A
MSKAVKRLLVTGLGTGYLRPAPGTWGSAVVAAGFLGLVFATGGSFWAVSLGMGLLAAFAAVVCVALGRFAQEQFGRKDPSHCTLDEFAGQALTYLLVPLQAARFQTPWAGWLIAAATGLIAFRFLDITKPFPARRLEKLPFGWGVTLDDLVAGLYANLISQLVLRLAVGMA